MKKLAVGILLSLAVVIVFTVLLPRLVNLLIEWSADLSLYIDEALDGLRGAMFWK